MTSTPEELAERSRELWQATEGKRIRRAGEGRPAGGTPPADGAGHGGLLGYFRR